MEKIIIIGGSAGSFKIVAQILASIHSNYRFPIIICTHRLRNLRSNFTEVLSINSKIRVKEVFDKEKISGSTAYIAPSNYHLLVEFGHHFCLSDEEGVNHSRPSIDITMDTVAEVFKERAIGILLSGANADGAEGMRKIKEMGGITIIQDPDTAEIKTMPESCLQLFSPDHIMDTDSIINFMLDIERI